jgi:glycosyltransferase involved in cell wall biosynthesis
MASSSVAASSPMTAELAAVVLTKNEESHIGDCLDRLAWADEQVVFDDSSTDHTVEIAQARGARVLQHALENFAAQRNAALAAVEARWILFVDSDERATPALADEVRRVIRYDGKLARAGWWIPRHNYMIGHRMRGGGWYPDYQLRLLRRGQARYDPAHPVHEIVILDGEAGYLENALLHYNYNTLAEFRHKMGRYTRFEAQILHDQGVRVRPWTYVSMPLREFWRRFVTLRGYQDHVYGLLFCGLMAWYTFVSYWRLRQLKRANT